MKKIKDGWQEIEGLEVLVEDGQIIRGVKKTLTVGEFLHTFTSLLATGSGQAYQAYQ